jgi:phosphoglycerol transferase MdoB-like AlkP superfamily enzyme
MELQSQHTDRAQRNWLDLLISLVFVGALISYFVAFGTSGGLAYTLNTKIPTKLWLAGAGLKYGLAVLKDAGIIWLGAQFARRNFKVSAVLRFWLLAVLSNIGLLLFIWLQRSVSKGILLDVLLPLTHGAQPLVIGGVLFLCAQPALRKLLQTAAGRTLGFALLLLPVIFNKDLFLLQNGSSAFGIFALLCAGLIAGDAGHRLNWRWLLLFPLGCLSLVLLGWCAAHGYGHVATATRFVDGMSPLAIVPATAFVGILTAWVRADGRPAPAVNQVGHLSVWVVALLMSGNNWRDLYASAYWSMRRALAQSRAWLILAVAIALPATVVVASAAYFVASRTAFWRNAGHYWNLDFLSAWRELTQHGRDIGRRIWRQYRRPLGTALILLVAQMVGTLLMNQSLHTVENIGNPKGSIFTGTIIGLFSNQVFGALALVAAFLILLSLTQRYWLALITTLTVFAVIVVANVVKIHLRSLPIIPSDLAEMRSISELMGMVSPLLIVGALIAIVALVVLIFFLEHRAHAVQQGWLLRGLEFILAVLFIGGFGTLNQQRSYVLNIGESLGIWMTNNNPLRFAQLNGPIVSFASGLNGQVMVKPSGYSKAAVAKVVQRYKRLATAADKTRPNTLKNTTVVFNLSESFADPTRIPGLTFAKDPMPYIRKLKRETTSGSMISYGYGGGTADMEYMSLTGLADGNFNSSMNTPYTQLVPALRWNPNIGQDFAYDSAIHPYTGSFYNRRQVYQKFGFNKFVYNGSKYSIIDKRRIDNSPYLSDTTAYANALKQVQARKGSQFVNLITIQNHMPFNGWYKNPIKVSIKNAALASNKARIETYATGVAYTDQAVRQFREQLDRLHKSVVWVFYGDHLPGIYTSTASTVLYHQTDYFVYANKYARAHGAVMKQKGGQFVGPNDFIALALTQANAKLDGYNELLTQVQQQLPAIWNRNQSSPTSVTKGMRFVDKAGKVLSYDQLTPKQKQILHDYQLIQYDITAGKQYSEALGFHAVVRK